MQFSTDHQHRASLEILAEVRGFLTCWPAHPATRNLLAKIDAHLAEPTQVLVNSHESIDRRGAVYSLEGAVIVEAALRGEKLSLLTPNKRGVTVPDRELIQVLRAGLVIELAVPRSVEPQKP